MLMIHERHMEMRDYSLLATGRRNLRRHDPRLRFWRGNIFFQQVISFFFGGVLKNNTGWCVSHVFWKVFFKGYWSNKYFQVILKILWPSWKPMCPMVKQIHVQGSVLCPMGNLKLKWKELSMMASRSKVYEGNLFPYFFFGMNLQRSFFGLLDFESKGKI